MKRYRPPSLAKLNEKTASFNLCNPSGTDVIYTSVIDDPKTAKVTKTRSPAWVMGGHSIMVMVEGVSGGVSCDHVVAAQPWVAVDKEGNVLHRGMCPKDIPDDARTDRIINSAVH